MMKAVQECGSCVTHLCESFRDQDGLLYLVMDWCAGGDLFDHFEATADAPPDHTHRLHLIWQLLRITQAVHTRNVIHCDIKPENVFLVPPSDSKKAPCLVLGDFGCAKMQGTPTLNPLMGSKDNIPPEPCPEFGRNRSTDVWALGVTVLGVMAWKSTSLYSNNQEHSRQEPLTRKQTESVLHAHKPSIDDVAPDAITLLRGMLCVEPARRWTLQQCLAHSMFDALRAQRSPGWVGKCLSPHAQARNENYDTRADSHPLQRASTKRRWT